MYKEVMRGFIPEDKKEFLGKGIEKLKTAAFEVTFLRERGYSIKTATTFVGNHHLLSERQRLALARGLATREEQKKRKEKELKISQLEENKLCMDGFNTIITLEVAFSKSVIIRGEDGTIRDLAGLRGTYQIIDKTQWAIQAILETLDKYKVRQIEIYLDSPVSNSGRLKMLILELAKQYQVQVQVFVIPDVDRELYTKEGVITSDAIILDHCKSWVNLNSYILAERRDDYWLVEIKGNLPKEL